MSFRQFMTPPAKEQSVRLHKKGQRFAGIIAEEPIKRQKTKYKGAPGEMDTWPDGNIKEEWIFKLLVIHEDICDCEEFCNEGRKNVGRGTETDNKVRTLRVPSTGNLFKALFDASGDNDPEIGGAYVIARTGLDYDRAEQTGGKPPVLYQALYKVPTDEWQQRVKEYVASKPVVGAVPTHDGSPSMTPADLSDLLTVGLSKQQPARRPVPDVELGTGPLEEGTAKVAAILDADPATGVQFTKPGLTVFQEAQSGDVVSFDSLLSDIG